MTAAAVSSRPRRALPRQRGISLMEAIVALALMAFGMLGLVGLQATLRQNADVARQRSEAVRLAQEALESQRLVTTLAAQAGRLAWADLAEGERTPETLAGQNASYQRRLTVADIASSRSKLLQVQVQWQDRSGQAQRVQLVSALTGSLPELAATVGLPAAGGALQQRPLGRHPAIPASALDQGDGSSRFAPPGGGTLAWVFDNRSGHITQICPTTGVCGLADHRLLAGYVRFATAAAQPTQADAENPGEPVPTAATLPTLIQVLGSAEGTGAARPLAPCFEERLATHIAYYCAVPVAADGSWKGRSSFTGASFVASESSPAAGEHRVCRYTPVQGCDPAVGDTLWAAPGSPARCTGAAPMFERRMDNTQHPRHYRQVREALLQQNFLVIRAGNGRTAFHCPDDDPATPRVIGQTRWQPSDPLLP